MSVTTIGARFIPRNNRLYFNTNKLNSLTRDNYMDTFGFWQSRYGLYTYMQMNEYFEYTVHTIKGSPLIWQPTTSCFLTPTGSLSIGSKSIIGKRVHVNEKYCHDTTYNSDFEHFYRTSASGKIEEKAEAKRLIGLIQKELLSQAALGARTTLMAGQMFSDANGLLSGYEFDADTAPVTMQNLFKKTAHSAKGWVQTSIELAASETKYRHLNLQGVFSDTYTASGAWNGDIIELWDNFVGEAKKPLQNLINNGGVAEDDGRVFAPLFVVTDSVYGSVRKAHIAESGLTATNGRRITKQVITSATNAPKIVYLIDDIFPIIPLSEIGNFDKYLTGTVHGAWIVASGNIQIGTSFLNLPNNIEAPNMAMVVERDDSYSNNTHGQYTFATHAMMVSAIADPMYMVGSVQYAKPLIA